MTDVFERLHKLKGKTRAEIVAGSAHAEWETTDLFVQNTGRQGTGKLAEIVLAKCGQSQEDTATPLLDAALELRDTTAASTEVISLLDPVRTNLTESNQTNLEL